jgi:hypothetical protein
MADRLLSESEIVTLVSREMPGEAFTAYVDPTDENKIIVNHLNSKMSESFATQDRILTDADFIKNRVIPFKMQVLRHHMTRMVSEPKLNPPSILLDERGKTHGDYSNLASVIQNIKRAMLKGSRHSDLTDTQKESLDLIATKIGRIVAGDPHHHDHWDDIIGYATLARDRIAHKPKE